MRLEFGKMKKIKDMSKNEKMKYMFNLLPKYWGEIDENAGIARLQKALYYKTTNGIPIADQLKEIKFDMTVYEDIDQFLFLLTYIILTHSRRKIVSKEELLPNRKLINNIRNVDIDWDITDIREGISELMDYLQNDLPKLTLEQAKFKQSIGLNEWDPMPEGVEYPESIR